MEEKKYSTREQGGNKNGPFDGARSIEDLKAAVAAMSELKSFDDKKIDAAGIDKNLQLLGNLTNEFNLAAVAQKFESFNDVPDLKAKAVELANGRLLEVSKKNQFMNLESLEDMEKLFMHLMHTGVPSGFEADGFNKQKIHEYVSAIGSLIDAPVVLNPAMKAFNSNEDLHRQVVELISSRPL